MEPNPDESTMQKEAERSDAIPKPSEKFKVFLKDKLQERQHALVPSAPNSPSREKPSTPLEEVAEDEVLQVDSQGNSLSLPPHLAAQIDAIQTRSLQSSEYYWNSLHST